MEEIVIFGASGHARVISDVIRKEGRYSLRAFLDIGSAIGSEIDGCPVLSEEDFPQLNVNKAILGIGDNWNRLRAFEKLKERFTGLEFVSAIHPSAQIGGGVSIKSGSVVMAGVVINAGASIGEHCIVNTSASIDHDCTVDDFTSVNPGAVIGGNVYIGPFSAIGLGAMLIHGISVGEHSVIGAASAVVCDIPDRVVAFGSPCRVMRQREPGPYLLDA